MCNRQAAAQRMMVCLAFSRLRCPSRTTFVLTISAGSIYTVDRPIHTSTDTCHLESEFAPPGCLLFVAVVSVEQMAGCVYLSIYLIL